MSWIKATEFMLKDLIFFLLRLFLRKGRPELMPLDPKRLQRLLFLRHDKIGDLVVSLPVFDNLIKRYPHLELSILCSPTNVSLVKDDPRFAHVFLYRKNIFRDFLEIREIRRQKFDGVIDLLNADSTSGLFLSQLTVGDRPRIGVQKNKFASHYDYSYYHAESDMRHIIRNTLVVLEAFGIDSAECDPVAPPFLSQASQELAEHFLAERLAGISVRKAVTLVGVNLSVGQKSRRWSIENYVALIKRILREAKGETRLIIFTAPVDRSLGDQVSAYFDTEVSQVPAKLSLSSATAIVSKLDLFISPDTSMIHIARSLKIPVVGLYPTPLINFLQWHPFDQKEGAVLADSLSDIADIPVARVFDTYTDLLAATGASK